MCMVFKGIVSIKIVFPVTPQMPKKLSVMKTCVTLSSSHAAAGLEGRNNVRAEIKKKQVSNATFKCRAGVIYFPDFFFFFLPYLWPGICYADTTLLIWRTIKRGGPFRKCLLEKCQEQLLCHLFDSASLPFLQAIVLLTKIETKLMKTSRYVCYL